ncbi:hypothetical protein KCP75_20425 [Salmonella enterica subsp. enterica]|nr:hypothetical protein KCP75_20425 [Salmonella enterica subsp. enterica]
MMAPYKAEKVNPLGGCFPPIVSRCPSSRAVLHADGFHYCVMRRSRCGFMTRPHRTRVLHSADPDVAQTMFFIQKMSPTTDRPDAEDHDLMPSF